MDVGESKSIDSFRTLCYKAYGTPQGQEVDSRRASQDISAASAGTHTHARADDRVSKDPEAHRAENRPSVGFSLLQYHLLNSSGALNRRPAMHAASTGVEKRVQQLLRSARVTCNPMPESFSSQLRGKATTQTISAVGIS